MIVHPTGRAIYRSPAMRGPVRRFYRTLWVSSDGSRSRIRDMATPHIRNCLDLMDRALAEYRAREMSLAAWCLSATEAFPPYQTMLRELERRKEPR